MKRFLAIALVIGTAYVSVARGQTAAAQSDVAKADQALTQALQNGDRAAAEKMLDVDFSWVDPDGVYYATRDEAFRAGVKPLVGTGSDVKVLEHKYNKVVYVERSQGEKKEQIKVDLDKMMRSPVENPDVRLKPNDIVRVGTNAIAPFVAAFRNAFRFTYGFGFLYDRNYAPEQQFQ